MNVDSWTSASTLLKFWVLCTFLFLIAPVIVIAIGSLADPDTHYVEFPPKSLSFAWYARIPAEFGPAFLNSIYVAIAASTLSSVIGVLAAFGLVRGRFFGVNLVRGLLMSPLQVPHIVLGVVFLQFYLFVGSETGVRLLGTYTGLIVAHVIFTFPYVVGTVAPVLERFDRALEEAAISLGASKFSTFRRVTIPIIAPGVFAGGLFAFIMSFGDVPVSVFIVNSGLNTLAVAIFQAIEFDYSPAILALSTLIVVFSTVVVVITQKIAGLEVLAKGGTRQAAT